MNQIRRLRIPTCQHAFPSSTSTTLSRILRLNCLILGETLDRVALIKIETTDSVDDLKEAIMIKNARLFKDIRAEDLDLYLTSDKVAMLDDIDLMEALNEGIEEHTKITTQRTMSDIFPKGASPRALHILVQPPSTSEFV